MKDAAGYMACPFGAAEAIEDAAVFFPHAKMELGVITLAVRRRMRHLIGDEIEILSEVQASSGKGCTAAVKHAREGAR